MANEDEKDVDLNNEDEKDEDKKIENEDEKDEDKKDDKKVDDEDEKEEEAPEAKASRLLRQTNQARKKLGLAPLTEPKTTESRSSKKSDELGYAEKAFLNTNGIKGSQEYDFVQKELKASGETLDQLLENAYFQNRLESFRAITKSKNATITGKRGGGPAIDSVEYWATKPIEEVPQDMRIKVVNHKIAKSKNTGVFYNSGK